MIAVLLIASLLISMLSGCSIGSQHLEVHYESNDNESINNWEDVDSDNVTTWDNATIISWSDIEEYSNWVYSEILFDEITDEMPVVECRVLNYQSNGKYFDGEKVYKMVGDKFDVNSFVSNYAIGTGIILICVILTIATKGLGAPQSVVCFFAGAADGSFSLATKGAAFGAATKAVISAIKSDGDIEKTIYGALEGSSEGYKWGAIYGSITGGYKSQFCFTEETLVATNHGQEKIADIRTGDLVLAYDEKTHDFAYRPVTQSIRGETYETIRIYIGDEEIECTPTHPFLTEAGWIIAAELKTGSRILTENNDYLVVDAVEDTHYPYSKNIYSLCIEDYHTFLVGKSGLVVHNRCKANEKYANSTYYFKEGTPQAIKYPDGVPFDADGYPIFDQYAKAIVKFDFPSLEGREAGTCLIGNCSSDFKLANQAAGLAATPPGYTWEHHHDMMTMLLVPQDVHSVAFGGVAHEGGEAALKEFWAAATSSAIP